MECLSTNNATDQVQFIEQLQQTIRNLKQHNDELKKKIADMEGRYQGQIIEEHIESEDPIEPMIVTVPDISVVPGLKFAFNPTLKQMDSKCLVGLHHIDKQTMEPIDSRKYIDFILDENKLTSNTGTCQIEGLDGKQKIFVGTGTMYNDPKRGFRFILTCAHNVQSKSELDGSTELYTDLTVYGMRKGYSAYFRKFKVTHVVIHPKYDGSPYCGFDFALCFLAENLGSKNKTTKYYSTKTAVNDGFSYCLKPEQMTTEVMKGKMCSIIGYPGEKESYLYEGKGPIYSIHKTRLGGYIIAYDIDTTPGNSGSVLRLLDEDMVEKVKKQFKSLLTSNNKMAIGIHTGQDTQKRLNFGTLITLEINKWQKQQLKIYGEQIFDNYSEEMKKRISK